MDLKYFFIVCLSLIATNTRFAWSQEFVPAVPLGGERQLKEFINEELMYPEKARKSGTQGTVLLSVDVNELGIPTNVRIEKGVAPDVDAEAVRISRFLLYTPAMYMGKNVKSVTHIEIPFNNKKYLKMVKKRGYDLTSVAANADTSGKIYSVKDLDKAPEALADGKPVNLGQFIARNFKYPEEALRKSISGTVKVNFIIETTGRCSNVAPVNTIGAGCTEEAVRLVKMLQWKPGILGDKAVRVNVTIPVTFSLPDDTNFKSPQSPGGTTLY